MTRFGLALCLVGLLGCDRKAGPPPPLPTAVRSSAVFADGHAETLPVGVIDFHYEAGHERALWDHQ